MQEYQKHLKQLSRNLRKKQTEAEHLLWHYLRKKQIHGIQFLRQKPIGPYIVDFYAKDPRLVIEIDGRQHYEEMHQLLDAKRDLYLNSLGLAVLRFNNIEVLHATDMVVRAITWKIEGKPYSWEHGKFIELW